MLTLRDKFKFMGLAAGTFASYISMGVAIEKIFKGDFGGEKFTFSIAIVVAQSIVYTIVAKGNQGLTKYFKPCKAFISKNCNFCELSLFNKIQNSTKFKNIQQQ